MPRVLDVRGFIDPARIARYVDARTAKALNRFGGAVRKTAQYSMRSATRKKQVASRGQAPLTHKKKLLKRLLFYHFDRTRKSVVVGPIRLQKTADQHVPRLMEEGGTKRVRTQSGRMATLNYAPHPFMKPAFDITIGRLAEYFR